MILLLKSTNQIISKIILSLLMLILITPPVFSNSNEDGFIKLAKSKFKIVFSENEPGPIKIALEAFKKDLVAVMGTRTNHCNSNELRQFST